MLRAGSWPGHVEVTMSSGDDEYAGNCDRKVVSAWSGWSSTARSPAW